DGKGGKHTAGPCEKASSHGGSLVVRVVHRSSFLTAQWPRRRLWPFSGSVRTQPRTAEPVSLWARPSTLRYTCAPRLSKSPRQIDASEPPFDLRIACLPNRQSPRGARPRGSHAKWPNRT